MEPTRSKLVGCIKRAVARPPFSYDLLTQAELCNDCTIAVDVLLGEVVEKASALADHHQKAAAGMVVLLVLTQMLGQGVDPGGEDSDLDLGRTGIAGMGCVLLDNGSLFSSLRIIVVFPPFKIFPESKYRAGRIPTSERAVSRNWEMGRSAWRYLLRIAYECRKVKRKLPGISEIFSCSGTGQNSTGQHKMAWDHHSRKEGGLC